PVQKHPEFSARLDEPEQIPKGSFRVKQMMQHTHRINHVKALHLKRQMVEICLNESGSSSLCISGCNLDCIANINRPYVCSIKSGVIRVAANTAARIQNLLASEELGKMGKHIIPEVSLPLWIHFRKMSPFETKTCSSLQLQ